ncbi:hypothetical protein [Methanolobus sp.]|jgi:metal-responsive CopG/Arc/MetJ family transcriptional regulator|nr:hypothetical protein [Methanolobus sp.]
MSEFKAYGITLTKKVSKRLEEERGYVPRSTYINHVLEGYFEEKGD